jgi:hypothetical protein
LAAILETPFNISVEVANRPPEHETLYAVYALLDRFYHEATFLQDDIRLMYVDVLEAACVA